MRTLTLIALVASVLGASTLSAQPPPAQPAPPCPSGNANFACAGGQTGPEDLVVLPGAQWLVASSMSGEGGLALVRVRDRAVIKAYPAAGAKQQPDAKLYSTCPGPPAADKLTTHGLYLQPASGPVQRVLAVGHGAREAIEIFDVDTRAPTPAVTWVGCVVAPDPIGLNSVRGLPDGGFIATNFLPRGGAPDARERLLAGERNGELWEWHPKGEWQKVPGSESSGANGVELSPDGKTLYIAAWGSQSFTRLSRGVTPVKRDDVPLGFRVDNVHWASDGSLLAVGQGTGDNAQRWQAVKIDPETLKVSQVMNRADEPGFGSGTVAAEIGTQWWIGSYIGDRIAIVPAPPPVPTGLVVGSGNFFSPIVGSLDQAVAFYRDGLGLDVQGEPGNADQNVALRNMFGLPDAKLRWQIARPGGMRSGVEIIEPSGAGGKPVERRVQDPGAYTLIAIVRDLDATLARVKKLGAPVVSASGAPSVLPNGGAQKARMITVKDPAGHFVELVQPDTLPVTQAPATANVVDVHVRLAVDDFDRAVHLYGDVLGMRTMTVSDWNGDATIADALGVHGAQFRYGMFQVPTTGLVFEVIAYKGIDRKKDVKRSIADPGSTRIQLQVRDIDATIAAMQKAGGEYVSTGGKPLDLPAGPNTIKVGIVRDPDNLFVVLIQSPPPAAPR